jgi:hypothetical protein
VTGIKKDQDMAKQIKLIDHFKKVNDNYIVTNCNNGFMIEVTGLDYQEGWNTAKFIYNTVEELQNVVRDLAWMPKN